MTGDPVIEGVILAAGSSSRAGTFKPALLIGNKPMVERCIEGMYDVCDRIIVVGGHEWEQLRSLLEGKAKIKCIENIAYEKGMFTSVKLGLAHLRGDRCFVLPADIPFVPSRVYRQLLTLDADVVLPSFQGRNGHPACLSKASIVRILREPDESSLRAVIRSIGFSSVEVDTDEILIDIDTPRDLEKVRGRYA